MKKLFRLLIISLATIFALAACNFSPVVPPAPGAEKTKVTAAAPYDYYDDVFGVGKDHVFQTLVYNDLITLISDDPADNNSRPRQRIPATKAKSICTTLS